SLSATSAAQIAAVPPEPAVNGNFRVWIASFRAEEQAAREWSLIMEQHQNIFGGMQPEFRQVDLGDKGLWYRVVAGPFAARAGAETACSTLRLSNPAAFCRILEE
ncbi:MAG: SPOR domain-containing protein, partial [Pseudomonadota bacterium]